MKKKQNISTYLLISMCIFFLFANSCKKDDDYTTGTFTDSRDGNVYKTVTIGKQVWMAENLRYLPSVIGPDKNSETIPYYYVYNFNDTNLRVAIVSDNYITYGVLYNWEAARTACPAGWHIPSEAEWLQLIRSLGKQDIAGNKLKEAGTKHWKSPNPGATNETGFTALPGGCRDVNDGFQRIERWGYWWSREYSENTAWQANMNFDSGWVQVSGSGKKAGFSVRCIKD